MSSMKMTKVGVGLLTGAMTSMASSLRHADQKTDSLEVRRNIVHMVSPSYPHKLGRSRIGGSGVFRMTIDPKTGKVTEVAVVKSTGQEALDREAKIALSICVPFPDKVG
jgi:TonB family protein